MSAEDDDDDKRRRPPVTDISNPRGTFRPPSSGLLQRTAVEADRLDAAIAATESEIRTTCTPQRLPQLKRKLEILKAKRAALKVR